MINTCFKWVKSNLALGIKKSVPDELAFAKSDDLAFVKFDILTFVNFDFLVLTNFLDFAKFFQFSILLKFLIKQ